MAMISNSDSNTLISGTSDSDTIINFADNVTIVATEGNNTVTNYDNASNVNIQTGTGNDFIFNELANYVTITAEDGTDFITNSGSNVAVDAGADDDSISNSGNNNVTISGGAGNDSIRNAGNNNLIYGGTGNDYIYNMGNYAVLAGTSVSTGANNTINGGAGDDFIYTASNSTNVYVYNEGDDNDIIYNYAYSEDGNLYYSNNYTLRINSSSGWSSVVSGNDIVITVGDGSITLIDAAGSNVNITTASTETTIHGSIEYGGHTYYYITTNELPAVQGTGDEYSAAEKWEAAKAMCASLGGYLAIIDDANENAVLFDALANNFNLDGAYFGLTDEATEGTWIDVKGNVAWVSSETYTYSNWASGEPSNAGTTDGTEIHRENYAMFYTPAYTNGEWNDGDFSGTVSFICEVDSVTTSADLAFALENTMTGSNGNTYYLISANQSCSVAWDGARNYFQNLGGDLAIINDAVENQELFDFTTLTTSEAYFGLSDAAQEGTWTWVDGSPLDYSNWGTGNEPNGGTYENYGMFYTSAYPNGEWNDGDLGTGFTVTMEQKVYFLGEVEGNSSAPDTSHMYQLSLAQWNIGFTPPKNSQQYAQGIAAGFTPPNQ